MHTPHGSLPFGQWLKQKRRELDLTQEELAFRIGCSYMAIHKIEAGTRRPSKQIAELLAGLFQVPAEEREAFTRFARGLEQTGPSQEAPGYEDRRRDQANSEHQQPPGNLPVPLTRLIGREDVVDTLGDMLGTEQSPEVRLLTLTGPPGIGKTRLGIEVGIRVLDRFEDGVFFVSLALVNDPDLVPAAMAQALGLRDAGDRPALDELLQFLREKHLLLVLDNFEQVLDAAPSVLRLLGACPRLKVLVTSREALHVHGEQQFPVPPLAMADPDNPPPLQTINDVPAIALFVERARAIRPGFALTEENAISVAAICARLDGLPLAIELAAARVNVLSPQEIQSRLESPDKDAGQDLSMLKSGLRNLPARQRTLRNAIEWSYNLLSNGEQSLFVCLGVFVGGFALEAAQAVYSARSDPPIDVPEGVESLLNKNLLKREEVEGESRFAMLEVLRSYALEQLQRSGDLYALRAQHARFYLGLAQEAAAQLHGDDQLVWLKRLNQAYENIRAAISWSISYEAGAATALSILTTLQSYWVRNGAYTDARNLLGAALARANNVRSPEKAKALYMMGRFTTVQGDYEAGLGFLRQSLDLYRELGDREGMRPVLNRIGAEYLRRKTGDPTPARHALEEALAIARESGKPVAIGEALGYLAHFTKELGDHNEARRLLEEGLAVARQAQDKGLTGAILLSLGDVARLEGNSAEARSIYEECLTLFDASGAKMGRGFTLVNLTQVYLKERDLAAAGPCLAESFSLFRQMGHRGGLLQCIAVVGAFYLLEGDLPRAITILSAGRTLDDNGPVLEKIDRFELDRHIAQARALASEEVWASAWSEGQGMALEEAVEYASELSPGTRAGQAPS